VTHHGPNPSLALHGHILMFGFVHWNHTSDLGSVQLF